MLLQRNLELEPNFRSFQSLSACIFPSPLNKEGLLRRPVLPAKTGCGDTLARFVNHIDILKCFRECLFPFICNLSNNQMIIMHLIQDCCETMCVFLSCIVTIFMTLKKYKADFSCPSEFLYLHMVKTYRKNCLNNLTLINFFIPKLQGRATNFEIDFFFAISVLYEAE